MRSRRRTECIISRPRCHLHEWAWSQRCWSGLPTCLSRALPLPIHSNELLRFAARDHAADRSFFCDDVLPAAHSRMLSAVAVTNAVAGMVAVGLCVNVRIAPMLPWA